MKSTMCVLFITLVNGSLDCRDGKWLTSPRIAKIKENNKNEEAQK